MTKRLLLTMAVGMATATVGGDVHAAEVQKMKYKGNQVFTGFSGSTIIDCAGGGSAEFFANGFLSGAEQVFKSKGSPKSVSNGVFVDVFFFNGCTGETRFASGGITDGFDPPNRNLASSSLEGTTTVQDFNDGAVFPFTADVEVVGDGPTSAGRSKSHTRTQETPGGPFTITHNHSANANRSGIATGTISVAGVTLNAEFSSTTLSFNSNSTLTIQK